MTIKIAPALKRESECKLTKEEKKTIKTLKDMLLKGYAEMLNSIEKGALESNSVNNIALKMALGTQDFAYKVLKESTRSY